MNLYWRYKKDGKDGKWSWRPASEQLRQKVRDMGYGSQSEEEE